MGCVRSEQFRYVRYRDGSEELYDHRKDPHEWHNVADNPEYAAAKKQLAQSIPTTDAPWTKHSSYLTNDFFKQEMKNRK